MTEYTPDKWLVVKILSKGGDIHHRIFATWSGGYLDSDSWKMNSGIESISKDGDYLLFLGQSGSIYKCHQGGRGSTLYGFSVLNSYKEDYPDNLFIMSDDEISQYIEGKIA